MEFKKNIKINLNDEVRVKLTEEGIQVLAREHKELRKHIIETGGKDIGGFVLRLDEQGYYTTQLWILLDKFKDYFNMSADNVLEGNNLYVYSVGNPRNP